MARTASPRERLSVDLPLRFMRMLDEMRGPDGYTRTHMIMMSIEERYLLIQARKPTKGLASSRQGDGRPVASATITDDEATFFDEYGRMPEPGETLHNTTAARPWGKPKP